MKQEFLKRIISSFILISIIIFFIIKGSIFLNLFILCCFLVSLYEWHMMKKNNIQYVIGIIFLLFYFYSVFRLTNFEVDYSYFVFILLICISTDIGGYIFGKIFKGPKLTKISPQKTYNGVIGSFLISLIILKLELDLIAKHINGFNFLKWNLKLIMFFLSFSYE